MKGRAYLYKPFEARPEIIELDSTPKLDFLQHAVEGWIEVVPGFSTYETPEGEIIPCAVFCNEEGKLKKEGVLFNNPATLAWDRALRRLKDENGQRLYPTGLLKDDGHIADVLVGQIIVITGDDELMAAL